MDRIVVFILKQQSSPNDAFIERQRLLGDKRCQDLFGLFGLLPGVFQVAFEVVGLAEERVYKLWRFDKQGIEQRARPLRFFQSVDSDA